jgi:prepilin-type N-terminal cleavage/methylation domain-containing protein
VLESHVFRVRREAGSKSKHRSAHRRRGFTLVEVIVVLVILAILAAIAIPALTGYIDSADDKKWVMEARDASIAYHSVLIEAYADGTLYKGTDITSTNPDNPNYVSEGQSSWAGSDVKAFSGGNISKYNTGDGYAYRKKAAGLMGKTYPEGGVKNAGSWTIDFFAPRTPPSYTILDAPAFRYKYYPEGYVKGNGKPIIAVTYGLSVDKSAVGNDKALDDAIKQLPAEAIGKGGYNVFYFEA